MNLRAHPSRYPSFFGAMEGQFLLSRSPRGSQEHRRCNGRPSSTLATCLPQPHHLGLWKSGKLEKDIRVSVALTEMPTRPSSRRGAFQEDAKELVEKPMG